MTNILQLFISVLSLTVVSSTVVADEINNDLASGAISPNTWTDKLCETYAKASSDGCPIFIFWRTDSASSVNDREYLCRDSFGRLIEEHGSVYLLYADITKRDVRDFKRFLFKQVGDGSYDGFSHTGTLAETGTDIISNLPTHSEYSLIYVDNSQARFLFHVHEYSCYRGHYDSSLNYAYNPYHKEIKLDYKLFKRNRNNSTEDTTYDYPFLRVLDEYLSRAMPSPTPSTSVRVFARFVISVRDRLYKGCLESAIDTNKFNIIERSGCWFVDQDDILRCNRTLQTKNDYRRSITIIPKSSGTLNLKSDLYRPVFLVTANDSTNEDDVVWSNAMACHTNVTLRYDQTMRIRLYSDDDIKITDFNAE